MKSKHLQTVTVVLSWLIISTQAALGTKFIPYDTSVGEWDEVTRTYTLTSDLYETIWIDEDNLTLDGAGHTATSGGYGVYLNGRTGVTVKNLTMDGYIALIGSGNNTLRSNTVSNNGYYGIYLDNAGYNTISDNVIETNRIGIYLVDSNYNTFTGNAISNNDHHGMWLSHSSNNTITENRVDFSGHTGIWLSYSSNNSLTDNKLFNNAYDAIRLHQGCSANILTGNNTMYNSRGIVLSFANDNTILDNNASENTWTGIFIESSDGNTLTGNTASNNQIVGVGIVVRDSNNNTVANNVTNSNNQFGIYLYNASYNTVSDNVVESNRQYGIRIRAYSNNNTLTGNTVDGNGDGIEMNGECEDNALIGNSISSNNRYGIFIRNSINNTLTDNTIASNNEYGIYLHSASNSQVYNNNFIDNARQAYTWDSTDSLFNLDKPIGGNYWNDWMGPDTDGDGFVDNPYAFLYNGQDYLPWAEPDGWITPRVRIDQLTTEVLTLDQSNGFVGKLKDATKILTDGNPNNDSSAVNKLNDFINQVNNNASKILDAGGDPYALIEEAEAIIKLIEAG